MFHSCQKKTKDSCTPSHQDLKDKVQKKPGSLFKSSRSDTPSTNTNCEKNPKLFQTSSSLHQFIYIFEFPYNQNVSCFNCSLCGNKLEIPFSQLGDQADKFHRRSTIPPPDAFHTLPQRKFVFSIISTFLSILKIH